MAVVPKPAIRWKPILAENWSPGRVSMGKTPGQEMVVVHTTDGGSTRDDLFSWFNQRQFIGGQRSYGSTHFGIDSTGIDQYVTLDDTAYAHGLVRSPTSRLVLENGGLNPNTYGIGIELLDSGNPGVHTEAQYEYLAHLCAWLFETRLFTSGATGVAADRDHIIGHYEIDSISRAFCPSLTPWRWDWLVRRVGEWLNPAIVVAPPVPDYRAQLIGELRGELVAADDDALRAAVRRQTVRAKLLTLGVTVEMFPVLGP